MDNSWYRELQKPSWAPAEWVFGAVWSVLYPIIIGVNVYIVILLLRDKITWLIALPFWLNIFFNVIFTPIQFGMRNNALAFVDILLVLVTIAWAMIVIWPHSKWVTFAFVPYLVWVAIATVLQLMITIKN
jgi:tryptophan-rich sensory protein